MKILLIPSVKEIFKNQFEYCIDKKLILFLKKTFANCKIEIFHNQILKIYDLIVLSGGNNTNNLELKDNIRFQMNNKIYKFALSNKIKIIGLCHGAQYLAKQNGFKLKKSSKHLGLHKILLSSNGLKKKVSVNSYHNDIILMKNSKNINIFGIANDNSIEAFHIKNKKILGIIWHPERYNNFKKFDLNLFRNFYATNTIECR
jgi:gamma-glutamyl-gamma-aminobutyrate hydrolase PuuD